jgi:hypothetical protein
VTLTAKVSASGEVDSATASGNTGLSDAVVRCLTRKIRNAQFDSPGPEGSALQVPLTFTLPPKK